ncbi:MAG TPA: lysylphosphatidylglycerol synthase domain-containing protein, partial [Anaeromyxobacter sp.]|nr:lysylphosphatidylglycerol synthase domain-containing protein [Anaeromyxobacter sp.]
MDRHAGDAAGRRLAVRRAVAVAAGALAGAALVSLVFVRVGWDGGPVVRPRFELAAFAGSISDHAGWVVPFAALAACLPALRALVWRAVLPPPAPRTADAYHATALGALVHNTIPGKLGPVAAAWVLARAARRPFAPALSSQLVAKLLEMGDVVVLGAVAASVRSTPGAGRVVVLGAAAFVVLASVAAVTALGAPRVSARLAHRAPRVGAALASLGAGLAGAGRPRRLAAAAAL